MKAGRGASGTTRSRSRRMWRSRRAARRDRLGPDDDRSGVTQQPGPQALAEPARRSCAGTPRGSSHGARSSSVTTSGRPDAIGQRTAADRVVDARRRPAALRPPGRAERRPAEQERIDGHRGRAQEPGRAAGGAGRRRRGGRSASVGSSRSDRGGRRRTRPSAARRRTRRAGPRGRPRSAARDRAPGAAERRGPPARPATRLGRAPVGRRRVRGRSRGQGRSAGGRGSPRRDGHARSRRRRRPRQLLGAELDDDDERLDDDPPATSCDWPTRRSRNVIGTSDDPRPAAVGPERHLDLEDVAAGVDAVERDRGAGSSRARP